MRFIFAVLFCSLALGAAATDTIWFHPAGPTSHQFVKLHLNTSTANGCTPHSAEVTKSGNAVTVRWTLRGITGCVSMPYPWTDEVAIGVLEPGMHEVRFYVDSREVFPPRTLIVRDGAPPLQVIPSAVSTREPQAVRVFDTTVPCRRITSVQVDGVTVPVTEEAPCRFVFNAPPRPVSAADVTATFASTTVTATAALRYVDPAVVPDDAVFERVLVPVLYDGEGAYGSRWKTEGKISFAEPVQWLPDALNRECASGACSGPGPIDLASFGDHPAGLLLFVPRGMPGVRTSLSVRETSKNSGAWAAPVPVVREKDFVRKGVLRFPNVPFDPAYRATLRVYGIEGVGDWVAVSAGPRTREIYAAGVCSPVAASCNTARPAFAAEDLRTLFPALAGQGAFDVEVRIDPFRAHLGFWAFVTVTNNETQQMTVIPPQ